MVAKTKIAGLMMAIMALSVPLVYADNGAGDKDSWHQDGGSHHGDKSKMMAKILNLSDDQSKKLEDLKKKDWEAMKSSFEQMKSNKEAFDAEIVKATPDMGKINDIQTKIKALQAQMVDNRLNSILEIKKVLTPEQFAGYMALEKAKKMMMHHGHHGFGAKNESCKLGGAHKHWSGKSDKDEDSE